MAVQQLVFEMLAWLERVQSQRYPDKLEAENSQRFVDERMLQSWDEPIYGAWRARIWLGQTVSAPTKKRDAAGKYTAGKIGTLAELYRYAAGTRRCDGAEPHFRPLRILQFANPCCPSSASEELPLFQRLG